MKTIKPPAGALWLALIVSMIAFGFSLAAFSMALVSLMGVHHG